MSNVKERIEENLSGLSSLLGQDNVEDVKKRIADLIVNRVESDIRAYDYYLFYPENYELTIDEAFEKVEKKLVKMYTDAMLESAQEAVNRFKDIASTSVNETPGLKLRSCHKCNHCDGNRCKFYEDYSWKAHDNICAEEGFVQFKKKEDKKTGW